MRGEGLLRLKAIALAASLAATFCMAGGNEMPVRLRVVPGGAREAPPETRDILFMASRPAKAEWTFDLPSVCIVTNGTNGKRWPMGGWQRPIQTFEYSGLIHIPETGEYVFYTRRPLMGPAYLFINGDPVIEIPNRRRRRSPLSTAPVEWIAGKPVTFEKGTVEFRALGYCERAASFPLAWSYGGKTNITVIGAGFFRRAEKLRHTGLDRPVSSVAVDASVAGVDPFLMPEDTVHPELHVRSDAPTVDVVVSMTSRGGASTIFATTSRVEIVKQWGHCPLPSRKADDIGCIEWSASVNGKTIARGATRFVHAPFDTAPSRAFGGALFTGDPTNCVFVARSSGKGTNPPQTLASRKPIILVDCYGHVPQTVLNEALNRVFGGDVPTIARRVGLADLVTEGKDAVSYPWLSCLASLCDGQDDGTIVLIPDIGVRDEGIGAFERRLAAAAGILSEARGRDVVLVTPPRRAPLQGAERDMRQYAETVHRVADLYGLVVADVYTLDAP